MKEKYEREIEYHAQLLAKKRRLFNAVGYLKLLLVVLVLVAIVLIWRRGATTAYLLLTGALLLVTLAAWFYHAKIDRQVKLHRGLIAINGQYLDRIAGNWDHFPVLGREYVADTHPFVDDLDIAGHHSLFQMLNVAHTHHGRQRFAHDLTAADDDSVTIRRRQRAIGELAGKTAFTNLFQYHTKAIDASPRVIEAIAGLRDLSAVIRPLALRQLLLWVPPLVAIVFLVSLCAQWPLLRAVMGVVLVVQALIWIGGLPKTNRCLATINDSTAIFGHYAAVLDLLQAEHFDDPLLRQLQAALFTDETAAGPALRSLDSIISKTQVRHSGILWFPLNVLLLWDFRCAIHLSRWQERYGAHCETWFTTLGEFESLLCLAGLPNVCRGTTIPLIEETDGVASGRAVGHPLIPNETRVCNDLTMHGDILIISGSNMSGKTTFLRTVGVNLVLARAGAAVCAQEFRCSLFSLMSSMRISDDLGGGISTFYAELRQVGAIIEAARERPHLFFLIDELFRGTNSEDRLFGANAVIRELSERRVMGIITTHDLSLCALEDEYDNIHNYSFSERYEGDDMFFDYQMRRGKSRTTNARFLMKQIGILPPSDDINHNKERQQQTTAK